MNANLASIMPQVVAVWCRTGRARCPIRLLHRARESARANCRRSGHAVHRRVHAIGAAGLRHQQPVPQSRGRDRAGWPACPLLSRGCRSVLRLRRLASPTSRSSRTSWPTARSIVPSGRQLSAATQPAELPTLEERWKFVERDARQGTDHQDRADARQPGVPLHLQLLHRFDGRLPAAGLPAAAGRSGLPAAPSSRTRSSGGTIRTSASASTITWRRSSRRCHRAASGTSPRAASRCCPSRISSGSGRTASRPSCRASSRGTTWATSRRRGTPAWRR